MEDGLFYVLMAGAFIGFVFSLFRYFRPSGKNIWADEKKLKEFLSWNYLDERMLADSVIYKLPESFIHGLIIHLFGMALLSCVYFFIMHVNTEMATLIEFQLQMYYLIFMGLYFTIYNKRKKLLEMIDMEKIRTAVKEKKAVPSRISLSNGFPLSKANFAALLILLSVFLVWTHTNWMINTLFGLAVMASGMFALKITDDIPFSYQFVKNEKQWEKELVKIKKRTAFFIILLSIFQFVLLGLLQKTGVLLQ